MQCLGLGVIWCVSAKAEQRRFLLESSFDRYVICALICTRSVVVVGTACLMLASLSVDMEYRSILHDPQDCLLDFVLERLELSQNQSMCGVSTNCVLNGMEQETVSSVFSVLGVMTELPKSEIHPDLCSKGRLGGSLMNILVNHHPNTCPTTSEPSSLQTLKSIESIMTSTRIWCVELGVWDRDHGVMIPGDH